MSWAKRYKVMTMRISKASSGDVLLQVVFHCQMYAEQGRFGISDVITTLQEKLIRRHPHVFEAETLEDDTAVKASWDAD